MICYCIILELCILLFHHTWVMHIVIPSHLSYMMSYFRVLEMNCHQFVFCWYTTDTVYNKQEIISILVIGNPADAAKLHYVKDCEIQRLLVAVKKISSGDEPIFPYWLFKNCSFALSNVVAYIINLFISCSQSPNNWSNAIITPVPQVILPKCLSDLRPISVTPVLSRLCESYVCC